MAGTNGNGHKPRSMVIENRGGGWYQLPDGRKIHGRQAATLATLESLGPTLSGRLRFLNTAGLQYRGKRDVYTAAGYIPVNTETFDDYWSLYERDPIAGRIVDMPPKTTWKTPPEVLEGVPDDDPAGEEHEKTPFEAAWSELAKRLKVWKYFERVDRLSRIGRYAVLFMGTRGSDAQSLKTPLLKLTNTKDLLYLAPYAEKYAKIETWETNPASERFGLPLLYSLQLSSGVPEFNVKQTQVQVHYTRLIHVAEDTLTDDVFGRPILKRVLNTLMDTLKVSAATGEAYWQVASRILQAKIDPTMEADPKMMSAMGEAMEEMVHDLRRQFAGHGTELSWLGGETPNPADPLSAFKSLIAIGAGIPERVLFGSERGELASSQDERNYFGTINERQEQHAEPTILRAFIDRLLQLGALTKKDDEYTVVWSSGFELTDKEQAEANLLRAKAAKELTPVGGNPIDLVEIDGERNVWLKPSSELPDHVLNPPTPEPGLLPSGEPGDEGGGEEIEVEQIDEPSAEDTQNRQLPTVTAVPLYPTAGAAQRDWPLPDYGDQ